MSQIHCQFSSIYFLRFSSSVYLNLPDTSMQFWIQLYLILILSLIFIKSFNRTQILDLNPDSFEWSWIAKHRMKPWEEVDQNGKESSSRTMKSSSLRLCNTFCITRLNIHEPWPSLVRTLLPWTTFSFPSRLHWHLLCFIKRHWHTTLSVFFLHQHAVEQQWLGAQC